MAMEDFKPSLAGWGRALGLGAPWAPVASGLPALEHVPCPPPRLSAPALQRRAVRAPRGAGRERGQVLGRGLEGRRPLVGGDEALGEDGIGRGALARGGQRHGALCVEVREARLVELHLR
jgi:hypothetical protein